MSNDKIKIRLYKGSLQINKNTANKATENNRKWAKYISRLITKDYIKIINNYMKKVSNLLEIRNLYQVQNDIPFQTFKIGKSQKLF